MLVTWPRTKWISVLVYGSSSVPVRTRQPAPLVSTRSRRRMSLRVSQPFRFTSSQALPKSAVRAYPVMGARPLTASVASTARADPGPGFTAAVTVGVGVGVGVAVSVGTVVATAAGLVAASGAGEVATATGFG